MYYSPLSKEDMHKIKTRKIGLYYSWNYTAGVSSPMFWHFGKNLIFLLSIIIEVILNKLLCIVSLTLVICRHLQLLKTVPPTEKTAVELCRSKPHISAWLRKVKAMLDIKKTYQVQRSVINLVSAWSRLTSVQENHLSTFLFHECRANHGRLGSESIKVIGHSLGQVLEYYAAFLEVLDIYIIGS